MIQKALCRGGESIFCNKKDKCHVLQTRYVPRRHRGFGHDVHLNLVCRRARRQHPAGQRPDGALPCDRRLHDGPRRARTLVRVPGNEDRVAGARRGHRGWCRLPHRQGRHDLGRSNRTAPERGGGRIARHRRRQGRKDQHRRRDGRLEFGHQQHLPQLRLGRSNCGRKNPGEE